MCELDLGQRAESLKPVSRKSKNDKAEILRQKTKNQSAEFTIKPKKIALYSRFYYFVVKALYLAVYHNSLLVSALHILIAVNQYEILSNWQHISLLINEIHSALWFVICSAI